MLDIIVTHYKEPWKVGAKFFSMLDLQRGVDFSQFQVILVNDGEENKLPDEHFSNRPYPVKQISIPHGGVSAARNAGLKAATDEWVMFCDFDDMFSSIYSLRRFVSVLPAPDYDLLWTRLIVEDFLEGRNILNFSPKEAAFVFTHGKMYRRSYLVENNLLFDEELDFNEDSEFNALITGILDYKRIGEIKTDEPLYIWIRRENSVTSTPGRMDSATWGHFRRNLKVVDYYKRFIDDDRINGMVTRTAYDTYYMLNSSLNSDEIKKKIKDKFTEFWIENCHYFGGVSDDIFKQIQEISYKELYDPQRNIYASPKMIEEWLKGLEQNEVKK